MSDRIPVAYEPPEQAPVDEAPARQSIAYEPPAPVKEKPKTSLGHAIVTGFGAGGAGGFDDELGGAEQSGLKWLAKNSPRIASMMGIDPHSGDDDTLTYDRAVKENRQDKRQSEKDHPWGYGLSNATGAVASTAATGINPILGGAVQSVGELDEARGVNPETALTALEGAGMAYVGGKVGQGIGSVAGKVVNKIGQKAATIANAAEGRISDAAMETAERTAGELNGALGPPQAAFNKAVERLNLMLKEGRLDPAQYAKVTQQLSNHMQAGNTDLAESAIRELENFKPGIPTNPDHLFEGAKAGIEAGQGNALKGQIVGEAKNLIRDSAKSIPGLGPSIALGVDAIHYGAQKLSSDVVKRSLGNRIANALLSDPTLSSKYAHVIMGAASPAVAHNVLQQRDPEYRQALKKALESDDGNGN